MTKNLKKISISIFALLSSFMVNGQFQIDNLDEIPKIKKGITYITMTDPQASSAKDYIDLFKKHWTFSKIEFIKYSDIDKYLLPGNFFLTINGYQATWTPNSAMYKEGSPKISIDYGHTRLYLELWTCSERYFKKKKKNDLENMDRLGVARIELFTDFLTILDPKNIYSGNYDGDGHIRNWGLGVLKNYLEQLMINLQNSTKKVLSDEIAINTKLKELKKQTLYVPDYVLIKFNKFTGEESGKNEEAAIFKDYKSDYKIISGKDLNDKILNSKTPFYYLIYINSGSEKYINVINSENGEVIYSKYTEVSYNIKSEDLKDLFKKVN